jgi:hypothetical protein
LQAGIERRKNVFVLSVNEEMSLPEEEKEEEEEEEEGGWERGE